MNSQLLSIILTSALGCASTAPSTGPSSNPSSNASSNASAAQSKAPKRSYESLVKIGRIYCDSGKAAKALKPLNQAIAQNPNRPEAYGVLGDSLAAQNKLEESAKAYEKARSLGSQNRRLFQMLSSVYDVQKHYAKAIVVYRDWLKINPSDTEMRHDLSLSLIGTGQLPEAINLLKEVIAQGQEPNQAKGDLAYAYALGGQHSKATPVLKKLYPQGLPYDLLIVFVQTYESPKAALAFFDQFAVQPLDKNHKKIRAHLVGLTQK